MATGHDGPVAIAVSGGSDSMALLFLAAAWADETGRSLLVLTVDHGRRPEAADEACEVAALAHQLGHEARILKLEGSAASQDDMRRGRHECLARAACERGASLLLLGHTRNDAEETFLMRLRRGSSLIGAAGPQPVSVSPVWPAGRGLSIGRPLLGLRRDTLQAWLRDQEVGWVSDPGNLSDAYERVRTRKLIAALPESRPLASIVEDAFRLRALSDAQLSLDIETLVDVDASGLVSVQAEHKTPVRLGRLLSVVLQAASGSDQRPDTQKLRAIVEDIRAGNLPTRATLAGAWLQMRTGCLLVGRDPGEARPGWVDGVWDGRYAKAAAPATHDEAPFLVRHAMPDGEGRREIISKRLSDWAKTLSRSAELSALLLDAGRPEGATTRPG